MRLPWLPILAALALAPLPRPAQAQAAPCATHEAMARLLADRWGETRRTVALDSTGAMVEMWASDDTGTWTLTVTRPGGPTCMVAAGTAWEAVKPPAGEPA